MYHVIGTCLAAIFLYLISYIFYYIGYYSLQFHRKLWNLILASAFIITAVAGVFMALQINYKWNVPFVKSILKWHVEFGSGLAITGVFHFIWHLSYFKKSSYKTARVVDYTDIMILTPEKISTNLFIVGLVSSSVQLLLIREMMNITGGYELITGTFLGSWLICSAIGASIASKSTLNDISKINTVFSAAPLVSLLMLLFISRMFISTGETPSILASTCYTIMVLMPFCLVSGFTFIKLISFASVVNGFVPGKSFSIETAGGIVSGIIISMLTAGALNNYQLLLLIIILSVSYVFLAFGNLNQKLQPGFKIVITLLAAAVILFNPDIILRQILLPGIKVTGSEDTPYGNITRGNYKGEESVYYNQRLLSYNDDVVQREENIHYAMLQSDNPEKVIAVSGSLQSYLPEILKYQVKKVIFIERDPALTKSQLSLTDTSHVGLVIANNDAFRYIRNSAEKVDVIILLIPPPSTLLLNRYYTSEFFTEAKKKLNKNGIFMCSPGPGDNYLNKESLNLYSSVYNSLANVFKNVLPISGNKLYFIASDKELSSSVCHLSILKNIKNIYISPDFLSDDLIAKKSEEIISLMDRGIRKNSSVFPIASFHYQSYSFSKNMNEKVPIIVLLVLLFAVPVLYVKRRNLLMYFSASALAGYEIIVLLILQLIIGNMYQVTGIIIAGLMAGLALGSGTNLRLLNYLSLKMKSIFLFGFYIFIGFVYSYMLTVKGEFPAISMLVISVFLPALITGHIFRELTLQTNGQTALSATYSADLSGSAFGFILMSGFTVPAFGIRGSVFLLSSLILAGILFGTAKN